MARRRRMGGEAGRPLRFWLMLLRGVLRRCPHCGGGRFFRRWFTMKPHCPTCGYCPERQEGFRLGASAINIMVTEGLFAVLLVATIIATIPDIPVAPLLIAALALNLVVPIVFYPSSLTTWAAVDLAMRPLDREELAQNRERVAVPSPA